MFSGCDQRHVMQVLVVDRRLECTPFLLRLRLMGGEFDYF